MKSEPLIMNLRIATLALSLCLTQLTYATEPQEAQSRYWGAIACIDRLFFDGGYQEGEGERENLINEFLSHYQLPAYDEALYTQRNGPDAEIDTQAYIAGYDLCSQDVDYVDALGERYGYEIPEE